MREFGKTMAVNFTTNKSNRTEKNAMTNNKEIDK